MHCCPPLCLQCLGKMLWGHTLRPGGRRTRTTSCSLLRQCRLFRPARLLRCTAGRGGCALAGGASSRDSPPWQDPGCCRTVGASWTACGCPMHFGHDVGCCLGKSATSTAWAPPAAMNASRDPGGTFRCRTGALASFSAVRATRAKYRCLRAAAVAERRVRTSAGVGACTASQKEAYSESARARAAPRPGVHTTNDLPNPAGAGRPSLLPSAPFCRAASTSGTSALFHHCRPEAATAVAMLVCAAARASLGGRESCPFAPSLPTPVTAGVEALDKSGSRA